MSIRRSTYLSRFTQLSIFGLLLAVASKWYAGPGQSIVRGHLGDVLIVFAVYFLLRAVLPWLEPLRSAIAVITLAFTVELFQGVGIFNSKLSPFAAYWLGQHFDLLDMLAYVLGAALSLFVEQQLSGRARKSPD